MMRRLVSCSVVSVLTQNGEVCSADASVYGLFGAAHTWKSGHYFYDHPWLTVGVTILGTVAEFLHIFGLLFGVEHPGQCTGTGPCKIKSQ